MVQINQCNRQIIRATFFLRDCIREKREDLMRASSEKTSDAAFVIGMEVSRSSNGYTRNITTLVVSSTFRAVFMSLFLCSSG